MIVPGNADVQASFAPVAKHYGADGGALSRPGEGTARGRWSAG